MNWPRVLLGVVTCAGALLWIGAVRGQVQAPSFDKLGDVDRKVFSDRFQKELWPMLIAGGKEGCVGCHNGKRVSSLRFHGNPEKDFRMLLKEGFFLKDDAGSLLDRVVEKDKKRRMPPDNLPPWTEAQVRVLREFVNDLDKKNGPPEKSGGQIAP
jgi:hypothetical protein